MWQCTALKVSFSRRRIALSPDHSSSVICVTIRRALDNKETFSLDASMILILNATFLEALPCLCVRISLEVTLSSE